MSAALAPLKDTKTILLTTYKRDGTAVDTPVSIAFDGDRAFFRSYDKAWKTKRLRHNPRVQAAPSTFRGKPAGPAIPARATLLEGEQARVAARALARRQPRPPRGPGPRGSSPHALPHHALRASALTSAHACRHASCPGSVAGYTQTR